MIDNMICPYRSESKETFIRHNADHSKTKVQVFYTPQPCLHHLCPFYSDGTGEYVEGACRRVENMLGEE